MTSEDRTIDERLDAGIRQFNERAFFEAHDTLEDVWMDVRGPDRLFFQGLIQLAIGFYHLTCENFTGADHLLSRGVEKLEPYGDACRGVGLSHLVHAAATARDGVRRVLAGEADAQGPWFYPVIERHLGD